MSAIKGPIAQPGMLLTPKQLETIRAINRENSAFWRAGAEQFEGLLEKRGAADAHRLMEIARVIVQETGTSHAVAVRAAEAVEAASRRLYGEGRYRANARNKAIADKEAIELYRKWERAAAGALKGLDAAKRVAKYFKTQSLSRRDRARITDLLVRGKI